MKTLNVLKVAAGIVVASKGINLLNRKEKTLKLMEQKALDFVQIINPVDDVKITIVGKPNNLLVLNECQVVPMFALNTYTLKRVEGIEVYIYNATNEIIVCMNSVYKVAKVHNHDPLKFLNDVMNHVKRNLEADTDATWIGEIKFERH